MSKKPERAPECGKDFCGRCGDCLECYGWNECVESDDGQHVFEVEPGLAVAFPGVTEGDGA